jgi:hypothetical protein
MSVRKRKRILVVAHTDTPRATHRKVDTPKVIPLYVDLNEGRKVGIARLKRLGKHVYAILEFDFENNSYGESPKVFLGVGGSKLSLEDEVLYYDGGSVFAASILTQDFVSNLEKKVEDVAN